VQLALEASRKAQTFATNGTTEAHDRPSGARSPRVRAAEPHSSSSARGNSFCVAAGLRYIEL
jgi:hypothetical protein